jgi:hypothetical protein
MAASSWTLVMGSGLSKHWPGLMVRLMGRRDRLWG